MWRVQPRGRGAARRPTEQPTGRTRGSGAFDGSANLPLVYSAVIEDSSDSLARLMLDGERIRKGVDFGLPVGGDLEYTDEVTLSRALAGRREL